MPKILVVDDTALDRRLAGGLLESTNDFEVCYAESGNEALDKMGDLQPDLVLTDLQMPGLDGLQLVNSIYEKYPGVPVVLMTAHGSEVIAAQALASGAACYVPKTDLAETLVETVMHILAMADTDQRYRRLIQCATKTEFEFNLENDAKIIEPLTELIQRVSSSQRLLNQTDRVRMGVAVEQALYNAMFRGNLELSYEEYPVVYFLDHSERAQQEPFKDRRVYFRVLITPEEASFTVRDQGPGFDTSIVGPPADPESLKEGVGRGLVLMTTFMDEVKFNDKGNEVVMKKFGSETLNKPR